MTTHEYLESHLQTVHGGLARPTSVFAQAGDLHPGDLIDAAVDIAWERLLPKSFKRPPLAIYREGDLLVFEIDAFAGEYPGRAAA